jgi:hypothetical protein
MQVTPDVDAGVEIVELPLCPQRAKPFTFNVLQPETPPQATDRPARRRFAQQQQQGGSASQRAAHHSAKKRRCVAARVVPI